MAAKQSCGAGDRPRENAGSGAKDECRKPDEGMPKGQNTKWSGQAVDQTRAIRYRAGVAWALATTVVVEGVTLYLRFAAHVTAVEFNTTAPLLLQIHHMFWSIPLFLVATFFWRLPRTSGAILGIASGLVLSDLMHHCIVLPITVGNMGWHWP
jgi:hypothetical protein